MKIVYSDQPHKDLRSSIMLCGPTPRKSDVLSWRPRAIEILQEIGFKGVVLVPERHDWTAKFDYLDQVEWELEALKFASMIVFWVPRNMDNMVGLTTNVEFGYWLAKSPNRVIYGRPSDAPHTRYLDYLIKRDCEGAAIHETLESLLAASILLVPDPSLWK